jgi:hypothetical protein
MTYLRASIVVVIVCLCIGAYAFSLRRRAPSHFVSAESRIAAIRRARVWTMVDVLAKDLKAGPQGAGAFASNAEVRCDYLNRKTNGQTPKFICRVSRDDEAKVKYGRDNGEVFAEVAASRLLWALGFGAEHAYPVRVVCRGCPDDIAGTDFATILRDSPGKDIESSDGSGWSWPELSLVDNDEQRTEREALTLLATLIQHTDSKPEQQRLVCVSPHDADKNLAGCRDVVMLMHDVGKTFGAANWLNRDNVGSVNLTEWRNAAVWQDATRCVANLPKSHTGTLDNPVISDKGRQFLANLLVQLSDRQVYDLFDVARVADRRFSDNTPSMTTTADWAQVFKQKRDAVVAARCPS